MKKECKDCGLNMEPILFSLDSVEFWEENVSDFLAFSHAIAMNLSVSSALFFVLLTDYSVFLRFFTTNAR